MTFKLTWKTLCLLIVGLLSLFFLRTAIVHAETAKEDICKGIGAASGDGGTTCADPDGSTTIGDIVVNIVNILSVVVGTAAVVAIIFGGFKFVSSRGDSGAVKSARDTIMYAIIGLVVVAVAQIIVQFTVRTATQDPVDIPENRDTTTCPTSRPGC